jgi:negative regulator of flagellin synthesis FlgM
MKIGSNLDTSAATEAQARAGRLASTGAAATTSAPAAVDKVALSAAGAQIGGAASSDFDSKKVDAIRQAIREGRFTVNASAIADRLIADASALLAPRTGV